MIGLVFRTLSSTIDFTYPSNSILLNVCEIMSLNFGVGHIFYIIFLTFIESKLLPVANTEITNSIDNDDPNNDKGIINLTMPGTKWFV